MKRLCIKCGIGSNAALGRVVRHSGGKNPAGDYHHECYLSPPTTRVHWERLDTNAPACGEPSRHAKLTNDQSAITCGRCLRLLGVKGFLKEIHVAPLDSLMGRAFVDSEAQLNELCKLARTAIADYEAHPYDPPVENMADVLRGFLVALGRSE